MVTALSLHYVLSHYTPKPLAKHRNVYKMSSKGAGGVTERRLRPLWDAIDTKQYKTALKLASSLLVKHPDSAYLLVLKALVLERMGKADEALSLCHRVKESGPADDLTLSTLQIVFQRLDRLDQATICYEHACGNNPKNLELMMGLFNCYIREYSYLKQQQIAMKMYKLVGEERFLLWAVCSMQLQVFCGNGDKTLLQLAEALLKKRIDSHGLQELEALLVYVSVLEDQEKFETALDVLSTKLGRLFSIANDRLRLQGKLLLSSHQYKHAAEVFQEVLKTSSDDWATFLQFLDATLEGTCCGTVLTTDHTKNVKHPSETGKQPIGAGKISMPKEEAEKRLQMAGLFIKELQEMEVQELRRGPFLGSVEIEKRRLLLELSIDRYNESSCPGYTRELAVSILQYFRRFGHTSSFASDVEDCLDLLEQSEKIWLVEQLQKACFEAEDANAMKLLRLKKAVHHVEVLLGLKTSLPDKDIIVHALGITMLYLESLQLSKDLDAQESIHGEELLTLVASLLTELFWRTRHCGYLVEAILVLEFGLSVRRHTFQYKIMLISLYATLSAVSTAFDWYRTLDVKNILIETLSHHILPFLLKSTCWTELDTVLKETVKFYEDYFKEAADLTILAYRHCNYSKVLEFVQFKERLHRSHNFLLSKVEDTLLKLKQKADNLEEIELFLASMDYGHQMLEWSIDENLMALSFNEDLETRPWWSPAPDECLLTDDVPAMERTSNWRCKFSEREKRWQCYLRRRCLLPRLIHLSLQVVSVSRGGDTGPLAREMQLLLQNYVSTFDWLWDQLEDRLSDIASSKKTMKEVNVNAADLVSLVLFYTAYQIASQPVYSKTLKSFELVNTLVKNLLSELTKAAAVECSDNLCSTMVIAPGSALLSLVSLTTEAFAWLGLCLKVWLKSLQPAGKKKKKVVTLAEQVDTSVNGKFPSLSDVVQHSINHFCHQLEGFNSWLTALLESPEKEMINGYMASLKMGRESQTELGEIMVPAPGYVISSLESSGFMSNRFGPKLGQALSTWQPELVLRCLVGSQRAILLDLKENASSRLKGFKAMKA